jgi:hypothetical protein
VAKKMKRFRDAGFSGEEWTSERVAGGLASRVPLFAVVEKSDKEARVG